MLLKASDLETRKTRIKQVFFYMEKFVTDVIEDKTTKQLVLVPGPAGCGKSWRIIQLLQQWKAVDPKRRYIRISGNISEAGFYETCYEYSKSTDVIFLDDCKLKPDVVEKFKAATDTLPQRTISHVVKNGDIPSTIEVEMKVVLLTNDNVDNIIEVGGRLAPHYNACKDRAKYCNLHKAIRDAYDIIAAIHLLIERGDFKAKNQKAILAALNFMTENASEVQELSVRMFCDLMDIYETEGPKKWEAEAQMAYLGTVK